MEVDVHVDGGQVLKPGKQVGPQMNWARKKEERDNFKTPALKSRSVFNRRRLLRAKFKCPRCWVPFNLLNEYIY